MNQLRIGTGHMKIAAVRGDLQVKAGATGAFIRMMDELRKRGHEVDIYALSCSGELREELEKSFRVVVTAYKPSGIPRIPGGLRDLMERARALPFLREIARQIRGGGYDIVLVDHYHLATGIFPLVKGIRKAYYCYEPPRRYYERFRRRTGLLPGIRDAISAPFFRVDKAIDRWLARKADLVMTNSDYIHEFVWKAYGVFSRTVHLGVDSEDHAAVPGTGKEDFVLTIGVVQNHKGHDFVVRSLALVAEDVRPRLTIVYYLKDDRLHDDILENARSLGVDVEMKGFVDDDEFSRLHSAARFVVLGFVMEPSLEPAAFAYGLPIVAVREGGVREIIVDGETGLLTDRDESQFAAAVEWLMRNPGKAEEMGLRARKWLEENFTWEACGNRLEYLLEGIAARESHV